MSIGTLSELIPRENLRGFATATPSRYASGTLWPHGEWALGWAKERPDGGDWHEDPFVGLGVDDVAMAERASGGDSPLNLSDAPNSHTAVKRGKKGITGYGQQMVKAAGHLMQERWPLHRKTLGTITLPEMSQQARREVVAAWPEIVRQLLQWQARRLRRLGLPQVVVSVTEIQPKRLAESGQACLHLHQLWLNIPAKSGRWSFSPNAMRSFFSRLLYRVCPSYQGGHVNVNTKPVEGVVAAYLAKYMSKGKQTIAEALDDWGEDNCPATWWNMTGDARKMVKAATFKGRRTGDVLEQMLSLALDGMYDHFNAFMQPLYVAFDDQLVLMGWRGRFQSDIDKALRRNVKSLDIERLGSVERCHP